MQVEVLSGTTDTNLQVALTGELDALTAPKLYENLNRLLQEHPNTRKIILNCRGLTYLSSAGAGILLMSIDNLAPKGISLELKDVTPEVYNILDLLGLTKLMPVNHV
ncbi:MAG: STAS domain-containing protein [Bacteroidia bacterium]|nr:STAS domain-containing protein [Bacteroidia bacterium]MCX7651647.1 STAS domain-containing protein [Bacteroidia bacterium]MDW8415973.1 STAS domain-containing protein [Bacteroidia bacterium]